MTTEINTLATHTRAPKPAEILRSQLDQRREMFTLPRHISYEKFCSVVITAVSMDPKLLTADRASLLTACLLAAQAGLLLDKKQAALVIRKGLVTYSPMTAGLLKALRNSGELATIQAECVYERDAFSFELGMNKDLRHVPYIDGDRGAFRCAYAIANLKDGSQSFLVMTREQIEKRRAVSSSKFGPWVEWFDEMACKTVLRALCKVLPSSTDIDSIVEHMDADVDLAPVNRRQTSIALADVPDVALPASDDGEVIE